MCQFFHISTRVTSLALEKACNYPSACNIRPQSWYFSLRPATFDQDQANLHSFLTQLFKFWKICVNKSCMIHQELWYNHIIKKYTQPVCLFNGIHCNYLSEFSDNWCRSSACCCHEYSLILNSYPWLLLYVITLWDEHVEYIYYIRLLVTRT